jgi:hypothetical protein
VKQKKTWISLNGLGKIIGCLEKGDNSKITINFNIHSTFFNLQSTIVNKKSPSEKERLFCKLLVKLKIIRVQAMNPSKEIFRGSHWLS